MQTLLTYVMSCHVMSVTLTSAYFTVPLRRLTEPCLVASIYTVLNTSHASNWQPCDSETPSPEILGNGTFHNGDTAPFCTSTIIHPKKKRVNVKCTLYTTGGGACRYGVNPSHRFRNNREVFCGVSFVSF